MQWHITSIFEVAVKESQLLSAVDFVLGIIKIKHNDFGFFFVGLDKTIGEHFRYPINRIGLMLKTNERPIYHLYHQTGQKATAVQPAARKVRLPVTHLIKLIFLTCENSPACIW